MLIFFIYLLNSLQQGCFNDRGTFEIVVKIYMDRDSRHDITKYTHKNLPEDVTKNIDTSHATFESAHIKHYFGVIFNEVNKVLKHSNIQFIADYSDLYSKEFSELEPKYCGHFANIVEITENFLSDFENPFELGENGILILKCRHNNQYLPRGTHFASKNNCGKIHGILMANAEILKSTIAEGLYKIFRGKSLSRILETKKQAEIDACAYVQMCNNNYDGLGKFIDDIGVLEHKELPQSGAAGLSYKLGKNFIKSHDPHALHGFELEDEHYMGHDGQEHLNGHHNYYRHNSGNMNNVEEESNVED